MAMTALTPVHASRPAPIPCLTTGRWAGPIIGVVFAGAVLAFLVGLISIAV
jgi:hypothetical protein